MSDQADNLRRLARANRQWRELTAEGPARTEDRVGHGNPSSLETGALEPGSGSGAVAVTRLVRIARRWASRPTA